ncbi:MAG TPA: hypothetical protein VI756_12215 [Blastocatellia bacterium]
MQTKHLKMAAAALAGLYFLWCAWHPHEPRLIDGANLLIHEAGHIFFNPFGEFMMIAGGSLFQVIMPGIFVAYFVYQHKPYSAALVLFWVGESIVNVSVYAADAAAMELPLTGGPDSVHDWNYLLTHLGMLGATAAIGRTIHIIGALTILTALIWALKASGDTPESNLNVGPG